MNQPAQPLPHHFNISIPEDVTAGHYADFVSLWHTPDVFVLDFAALTTSPTLAERDGQQVKSYPTKVVSRVRIPPSQVFALMRALEQQLSSWERETGRRPGDSGGDWPAQP